jgi:hypothetical protein
LRRRHETHRQYSVTVKCRHRHHPAKNRIKPGVGVSVLRDAIPLVPVPDTACGLIRNRVHRIAFT